MIRNLHRSRQVETRVGYDYYRKQELLKRTYYYYSVKRNYNQVFMSRYISETKPQQKLTPLRIGEELDSRFKLKCKLCDFYTNQTLLYERHLSSNNHHIRLNQF